MTDLEKYNQDYQTELAAREEKINDLSLLSKAQLKRLEEGEIVGNYGQQIVMLHFRHFHQRRGIGNLITSASHMAITVQDIGVSAAFYSDVLGLPQIERPNFDRFGAWFTVGNIELHLIKGLPFVATGEDLIVPHLAIETDDVDACIERLEAMDPPIEFQLNVSVVTDDERGIVKQIFIRDPDGYYVEVGQTHVLTKFCLGLKKHDSYATQSTISSSPEESPENSSEELLSPTKIRKPLGLFALFKFSAIAVRVRRRMANRKEKRLYVQDRSIYDAATVVPDAAKLANMMNRVERFGCIFNNKTEADIIALLKKYNNYSPDVCLELTEQIEENDLQTFDPPTYYDNRRDTNPGQLFEMPRVNRRGHIFQKGFYKPGDELFRYNVLVEDQERIIRRVAHLEEKAEDDEILADIKAAHEMMQAATNKFIEIQRKIKAKQASKEAA